MIAHLDAATGRDSHAILALREELEEWLEAKAVQQWGRGTVRLPDVQRQVEAGEWHVVRSSPGYLSAALRLLWADEPVWQHQHGHAAYVHGLMVARWQAGQGLGSALLGWAEQEARTASVPALRLDCVETNLALRTYYKQRGFTEVGRRDFDGPWYSAVLLEKVLRSKR